MPPAMDWTATFSSTMSPAVFCFGSSRIRTERRESFSLIAHASASRKFPCASKPSALSVCFFGTLPRSSSTS